MWNTVQQTLELSEKTILEEGTYICEVLDLGFGKCKMCVWYSKEAEELLKHREQIRVATKYPKIANDYFIIKNIRPWRSSS